MTSQQMALRRVGHYGQPFWRENDLLLILSCPAPNGQVQELLPRSLVAAKSGAPSPEHSRNYVIVTLLRDSTLVTWPLSILPSLLSERKPAKSRFAPNAQRFRGSFRTTLNCNKPRSFARETIDPGSAEKGDPMLPDSTAAIRAHALPHTLVAISHPPRAPRIPTRAQS